jgi:hypothetical protein
MVQACRCVGLLLVLHFNAITCHDSSAEKLAQDLPLLAVDDRARGEGDFMKLELLTVIGSVGPFVMSYLYKLLGSKDANGRKLWTTKTVKACVL